MKRRGDEEDYSTCYDTTAKTADLCDDTSSDDELPRLSSEDEPLHLSSDDELLDLSTDIEFLDLLSEVEFLRKLEDLTNFRARDASGEDVTHFRAMDTSGEHAASQAPSAASSSGVDSAVFRRDSPLSPGCSNRDMSENESESDVDPERFNRDSPISP